MPQLLSCRLISVRAEVVKGHVLLKEANRNKFFVLFSNWVGSSPVLLRYLDNCVCDIHLPNLANTYLNSTFFVLFFKSFVD